MSNSFSLPIWNLRPTKIEDMPPYLDYVMCIDENGNSGNMAFILKQISRGLPIEVDERFFTCIMYSYNTSKEMCFFY